MLPAESSDSPLLNLYTAKSLSPQSENEARNLRERRLGRVAVGAEVDAAIISPLNPPLKNLSFREVIMAYSFYEIVIILPQPAQKPYPPKLGGGYFTGAGRKRNGIV